MGMKDKAEGKAKEVHGKATGSKTRELEGKLQQAKGTTTSAAKGNVAEAKSKAKKNH